MNVLHDTNIVQVAKKTKKKTKYFPLRGPATDWPFQQVFESVTLEGAVCTP